MSTSTTTQKQISKIINSLPYFAFDLGTDFEDELKEIRDLELITDSEEGQKLRYPPFYIVIRIRSIVLRLSSRYERLLEIVHKIYDLHSTVSSEFEPPLPPRLGQPGYPFPDQGSGSARAGPQGREGQASIINR